MTANTEHIFNTGARSRIDAAITASATSLTLIPGGVVNFLPGWSSGKEFYCTLVDASRNREIVKVTALSDHTFTIVRGQDSSTARAWPIGTMIAQRPVAANYDRFIQKGFRTVTSNPNGVLTGAYDGEKVFQSTNWTWWISMGGTVWKAIIESTELEEEIVSSTADGYIYKIGSSFSSWAWVHAPGTASSTYPTLENYGWALDVTSVSCSGGYCYRIRRGFFYFDLSGLSGPVNSCSLVLRGDTNEDATIVVQQGTQASPFTTADWGSHTGNSFGSTTWDASGFNTIAFNSTGIAYIQTIVNASGIALLCCREYDHDYLDVAPSEGESIASGCYFAESTTAAYRPKLLINP